MKKQKQTYSFIDWYKADANAKKWNARANALFNGNPIDYKMASNIATGWELKRNKIEKMLRG